MMDSKGGYHGGIFSKGGNNQGITGQANHNEKQDDDGDTLQYDKNEDKFLPEQ